MRYLLPLSCAMSLAFAAMALAQAAKPPVLFPQQDNLPRVMIGAEGQRLNVAGDRIIVEGLAGRAASAYFLLRPGPPLTSTASGRRLGRSNIHLGRARVEQSGSPAVLRIEHARREIRPGDYLLPIVEDNPTHEH